MLKTNLIELAKIEALKSEYMHKVGAVLFKGRRIISKGCNSTQYLGWAKKYFNKDIIPTRHAEFMVCNNITREELIGSSLVIVRVGYKGVFLSAKPCPACIAFLKEKRISEVFYTNYNGEFVCVKPELVDLEKWGKEIV